MDGGGRDGQVNRCMDGEKSDINRILLRYRPIAPKPVVGGSGAGSGGGSSILSGKRTKRKYVRVSGKCKNKDKEYVEEKRIVTLQLLPERADLEAQRCCSDTIKFDRMAAESNNNENNNDNNIKTIRQGVVVSSGIGGVRSSRVIESWVTVESVVIGKRMHEGCGWISESGLLMKNDRFVGQTLEGDSCPGFISRAESGRVEWVNEAYRRMVVGCGSDLRSDVSTATVVLRLEIKEEVVAVISRVRSEFSCWVKVQNSNEDGRKGVSMVLPCDAWRVERGEFAWRLDARAALCLGFNTDNSCFCPS